MRTSISTSLALLSLVAAPLAMAAVAPGTLDPAFGDGGRRTVPVSLAPGVSPAKSTASVLGPDNHIYLAGTAAEGQGIVLSRLLANGDIDVGFGDNGALLYKPSGLGNTQVRDAAFDASGRLVVVGSAVFAGYTGMMVCRFGADGAPELAFGVFGNGCTLLNTGNGGSAEAVLMQHCPKPDECPAGDRILVAGVGRNDGDVVQDIGMVVALLPDGTALDTSFGSFGVVAVPGGTLDGAPTRFSAIAQDAEGNLAVAGSVSYFSEDRDILVARLSPAGLAEIGFGGDGYTGLDFDLGSELGTGDYNDDRATAVHLFSDGSVLVAGFARADATVYRPALVKLLSNGDGDPEFDGGIVDGNGKLSYALCDTGCSARAYDLAVLPDGRIVIAGEYRHTDDVSPGDPLSFGNNFFALRLLTDGTPDAGFGSPGADVPGLALVDFGGVDGDSNDLATDLLVDGDRLLLAGRARTPDPLPDDASLDNYDLAVARLGNGNPVFADSFED